MLNYFTHFPKINYNGKVITNITRSVRILDDLRNNPYAFLPYTIKDGERAEDIANFYYDSVGFTWLVYLSANIIDPYKQWPLDYDQFNRFLKQKYQAQALADEETNTLSWTQNTLITSNIKHYRLIEDESVMISPYTFENDSEVVSGDWEAVRIYDYENQLNEDRREITLLNSQFKQVAEKNLKEFINDK